MGLPYVVSQNPKIIDFELEIHFRVARSGSHFVGMEYPWVLQVVSVSASVDHLPDHNFGFLDLKLTYNHRSHHGASLCNESKIRKSSILSSESTLEVSVRVPTS